MLRGGTGHRWMEHKHLDVPPSIFVYPILASPSLQFGPIVVTLHRSVIRL